MVQEKNNATCSICGNPYHRCLSCRDTMKLQPWKMFTDSAEHYKVFQAVRGYNTGVYTEDEFKSKLKNIDLSDLENYKEHIKKLIKTALKEEPVVKTVEMVEAETVEAEITIKEIAVEKPTYSRKKNYKEEKEEVE